MLDTDISSYIIKRRPATLLENARIRSELERSGKPIGNMDLLIASHAVSQRMILVTNNLKHFSSVPGLTVEVWS